MAIYRVMPVENNQVRQYRRASDVASFLLGRRVSAYIIIKTDITKGNRIVDFSSLEEFSIDTIQATLENS